jgi:hypothetical protein
VGNGKIVRCIIESHACLSFKLAGVGTNGVLECKLLLKNPSTVHHDCKGGWVDACWVVRCTLPLWDRDGLVGSVTLARSQLHSCEPEHVCNKHLQHSRTYTTIIRSKYTLSRLLNQKHGTMGVARFARVLIGARAWWNPKGSVQGGCGDENDRSIAKCDCQLVCVFSFPQPFQWEQQEAQQSLAWNAMDHSPTRLGSTAGTSNSSISRTLLRVCFRFPTPATQSEIWFLLEAR